MRWMVVLLVVIWDIEGRIVCGGSGGGGEVGLSFVFDILCLKFLRSS